MSMTYRPAKLTTEELHEVKHLMGGAVTLLSLWALLSLEMQSGLLITAVMIGTAFLLIQPVWASRIPAGVWRFAGPLLLLVIVADFLIHLPEFIPSLVRMVVLLLLYRNLAPRHQREDLQLILLCLFCLVMSGVMTVSLLFAFQILLFTPLAMALLFVVCILDKGDQTVDYDATWENFSWGRLVRRVWRVLDFKVLSLGAVLFAFVVLVSTFLFVLMPRFNIDQAIPFLQVETRAMTGFSEQVELGDVTSVQNDNAVAIRIDVPSIDALEAQPYWRMLVLDRYLDGRFEMSSSLSGSLKGRSVPEIRPAGANRRIPEKNDLWTFYVEGGVSRYLAAAGDFRVMRFQTPQNIDLSEETKLFRLDQVTQSVFSYQIEDMQFEDRIRTGRREREGLSQSMPSGELEEVIYPMTALELALSDDERDYLREVNAEIRGGEELSLAEYRRAVTEYLENGFQYSLQPDGQVSPSDEEEGVDPVINWLREGSRGHCELFASAFVLLAREAGYPARLIVGFVGGSWNSVEDYFVVRNRDAHAWVEVYDRESEEWFRVDPTPGNEVAASTASQERRLTVESGWDAWIDSLRIQWYRRVVNFEQEDQVEIAMSLKEMAQAFSEEFAARAKEVVAEFRAWISQPFSAGNLIRGLVVILFVLSLYFVWRARYIALGLLFKIMHRPRVLDPTRLQASRYLRRLHERHGETVPARLKGDLQALRFGPEVTSEVSKPIFGRARKALRSKELDEAA